MKMEKGGKGLIMVSPNHRLLPPPYACRELSTDHTISSASYAKNCS